MKRLFHPHTREFVIGIATNLLCVMVVAAYALSGLDKRVTPANLLFLLVLLIIAVGLAIWLVRIIHPFRSLFAGSAIRMEGAKTLVISISFAFVVVVMYFWVWTSYPLNACRVFLVIDASKGTTMLENVVTAVQRGAEGIPPENERYVGTIVLGRGLGSAERCQDIVVFNKPDPNDRLAAIIQPEPLRDFTTSVATLPSMASLHPPGDASLHVNSRP